MVHLQSALHEQVGALKELPARIVSFAQTRHASMVYVLSRIRAGRHLQFDDRWRVHRLSICVRDRD